MYEGHLNEIEILYIKQYPMLIMYATRVLHNKALAEEAVQETFRIACQKADVLCKSENREGWLINTLKYVIANMEKKQVRANRRLDEYKVLLASCPETNSNHIDLDLLYKDISSTKEYILIKELVIEQKSIRELAEKRGISIAACKKRIQRAKQVLRQKLKDDNSKN